MEAILLAEMNHTHLWDWDHSLSQLSAWMEMEFNLNPKIVQPKIIVVTILGLSTPVLLFLLLCALSYAKMTFGHQGRCLAKWPQYRKFPLIGQVWTLPWTPDKIKGVMAMAVKQIGRRQAFWMGNKPMVFLLEAQSVQKILSSTKHVEKSSLYSQFQWLLGNGLITSKAKIWKDDRRILSPSFKYQRLDGFLAIFNKYSHILINVLESTCSFKEVVIHPILCRATMDFIHESALGEPSYFQFELDSKFFKAIHKILNNFRVRVFKPYLTLPFIWDIFGLGKDEPICKEIISKIVCDAIKSWKERRVQDNLNSIKMDLTDSEDDLEPRNETSSPFIDALIPTKSDADILAHVLTIFGAGFETTASGMNYTLFLLALHPHIQARVHEEIDTVLGRNTEGDVTFAQIAELKYVEICVKEALRLFPPAPIFMRNIKEDVELDGGLTIPSGCDAIFNLYELHRDPAHFPDPEAFIPERFLPEACVSRHPYAYMPFSIGPRNCLGMRYAMVQMKCCLVHILRRFKVSTKQRREDLSLLYGMVLEPNPAIKVILTPRREETDLLITT